MVSKLPVIDTAPKRIKQIEFGVFSAQDAKQMSVLELYERNLFEISGATRIPAKFGVLDRRLGTASKAKGEHCETCKEPLQSCVGHFGVVRLTLPVFHVGYFKAIITVLQNVCKCCCKVLLDEKARRSYLKRIRNKNIDGVQRSEILKSINVACKKVTVCPHCEGINGAVKKVGAMKIIHEKFKRKKKTDEEEFFRESFSLAVEMDPAMKTHVSKAQEDLNPIKVIRMFQQISNEDCELMGLDPINGRPELFIWSALPVPPVSIRPSVGQEAASTEDDLTVLMSEIVEVNTKMRAIVADGVATNSLMDHWEYLQLQTAMYVSSELTGVPMHLQANLTKIKKGLCQRMKGKHGRFRGNLSGKRVDFSGRTVISPDPNLRIDQVAVPERVAKILTYPERVTEYNIEKLRKNVQNGPDVWPGAMYIQRSPTEKVFLRYAKKQESMSLKVGDIVERHLQDNDVVLFNRQPSLHKLSIMAHFAKVRPWRTFRFNECVCTPYNADFDGDEMNLHLPQTEEARAEAMHLMGTKNNLVTPRNGEPLIAATQDFITCCYLLSRKDVFYTRAQFSQICNYIGDALMDIDLPPPCMIKPIRLWTGKQVFSVLMRPKATSKVNINLETKCRTFDKPSIRSKITGEMPDASMCRNDGYMVIYNSEIMCGVVDKSIIGDGSKKSMFYVALRDYGPEVAASFMNRVAKLAARWMANKGFSIGIDDVQPGAALQKEKQLVVEKGYTDCDDLIAKSSRGDLENQPGSTQEQTLESHISGILSKIRDELGNKCMKELDKYNAPLIMSLCGSKGSKINVSQMVACVGQQIISGSRVPDGFGDRSLPHFPKYSKTPAAKGFVRNSFYSGLAPTEFLFHAISGREGLVDTAVKTAETGYMQRRLMKALEDLTVHYDGTVRSATGGMVQFKFGDDGLDPACIEGAQQPVEFQRNLKHSQASISSIGKRGLLPYEIIPIVEEAFARETGNFKMSDQYKESLTEFIQENVVNKLSQLRASLGLSDGLDKSSTMNTDEHVDFVKFKITREQLDQFLKICSEKYATATIEPGTGVGAIGAQSIGEPGTQMTLKTFHFAGVASMNVTLGVPRIKEIINASKTISTPIIDASLDLKSVLVCNDPMMMSTTITDPIVVAERAMALARLVKGRVEKTMLGDIIEYIQEVVTARECVLKLKVDMVAIDALKLEVDAQTLKFSIAGAKKLKIPYENIRIESEDVLKIVIPSSMSKQDKGDSDEMFTILQMWKRALPKVIIKGIPTVNRAVISGDGKDTKLLVEGLGLREVMNIDGVDGTRTKSNHTLEMHKTLGIEAARNNIIDEIIYTMVSHGMTIDRRHVMLMADLMTFKGEVLGITRFGIAKMKDSVLMLASFEKTTDHLFDASFYAKKDKIEGVSECIILGIPMSIGTGLFKVVQRLRAVDKIPEKRKLVIDY